MAEIKSKIKSKSKKKKATPTLNKIFVDSAHDIATKFEAKFIFLYADMVVDQKILISLSKFKEVVFLTKNSEALFKILDSEKKILQLPHVDFTRVGLIKISTLKALSSGLLSKNDKVVFLTGVPGLNYIDSLLVIDIAKEFEILTSTDVPNITENITPEVFETVLNIAIELASQGREGKAVGTIFVIGDEEKVMQLSRQMIINPFRGYSDEERSVLSHELVDTIKEFSALDGAFIIREDGVLLAAGRHLSAAIEKQDLPMGLGSRHVAAAGITALTNAVAIVISESTGDVRIFKGGNIFMDIEKPVR